MCFERFPDEIDRTHIVIRLQIQNGGDASCLTKPVNVIGSLRMRTEEKTQKNLGVVHYYTDENSSRQCLRPWQLKRGRAGPTGQICLPFLNWSFAIRCTHSYEDQEQDRALARFQSGNTITVPAQVRTRDR